MCESPNFNDVQYEHPKAFYRPPSLEHMTSFANSPPSRTVFLSITANAERSLKRPFSIPKQTQYVQICYPEKLPMAQKERKKKKTFQILFGKSFHNRKKMSLNIGVTFTFALRLPFFFGPTLSIITDKYPLIILFSKRSFFLEILILDVSFFFGVMVLSCFLVFTNNVSISIPAVKLSIFCYFI